MIKTKIIKKIFTTTITMFIILTLFSIPITSNRVLRTNLEIEDITSITTDKVYLLDNNKLLVKTDIFINSKSLKDRIEKIINYLIITNNKTPYGLNGYIPKNTKIKNINIDNKIVEINFTKDLINTNNIELVITGIVYSVLEIDKVDKIKLLVEDNYINGYNKLLDKSIGINKEYIINNRKDINKVVIYYLEDIDNNMYFIPITKYLNDNREKIEIIIDEIKNTNNNLISYINNNLKLIDYKEENNALILNFNEYLIDNNDIINEYIYKSIAYSAFDNYKINTVFLEVNGKKIDYIINN